MNFQAIEVHRTIQAQVTRELGGKKLDDFLIDKSARKGRRKLR